MLSYERAMIGALSVWERMMRIAYRKRGIKTNSSRTISRDVLVEPPVFLDKVIVGPNVMIGKHTNMNSGILWSNIRIGRYCSISHNVHIAPTEHPTHYLSTWDSFYKHSQYYRKEMNLEKTVIGNDVWIGANAVIKRGVNVGDGAVIGAGAVVVKNVPAFSIVAGVPARLLRYRFDEEIIAKLQRIRWWDIDENVLQKLHFNDIEDCIKTLERVHS